MVPEGHVLRLNKALYGTKQAGRCWWLYLKQKLGTIGFKANLEDQSTYTYSGVDGRAFLWIHVDDGVFVASNKCLMRTLRERLSLALDLKWDEQLASIVGIRVREVPGGFRFDQPNLLRKIIDQEPSNICAREPLLSSDLLSNASVSMDLAYLSRIGAILYLAQGSRPDIAFAEPPCSGL